MSDGFNEYIKKFDFWDKLTDQQKSFADQHSHKIYYKKGEIVHNADEHCTGAMYVVKGELRAYMVSDEGKEVTLYRLEKDDFCMLSASCIINSITFDVTIQAEEDTEAYIVDSKSFYSLMKQNVYVENFALNIAVERFSTVMWSMQQILFMSFDKRLAIFLLDELSKTGSTTIKITHDKIAKYIGSAREVVTRMLKLFAQQNLVSLKRGQIDILDKKGLLKIAQ